MRVGFFGGSFDPPHLGHLAVARAAADAFNLDQVLLAPTGVQPLKPRGAAAAFSDRLQMVELLCREDARLGASVLDGPASGGGAASGTAVPNYTIDALRALRASLGATADLFSIVGVDAFLDLRRWRDSAGLLEVAEWIVVSRPGFALAELDRLELSPAQAARVHLLPDLQHPVSATHIRRLLEAGESCEKLLLPSVLGYIREHGLYLGSAGNKELAGGGPHEPLPWGGTRSSMPSTETKQLLAVAVAACEDKKAEDIRILALDPVESGLSDYFLICNGTNDRQNVAITDEIEIRLKREFGVYPTSVEGRRQGEWVLMDYVDFIVHVFSAEKRAFYGLERLRKSATSISVADLNAELKAAIVTERSKTPARKASAKKLATTAPAAKKAAAKKAAAKQPATPAAAEKNRAAKKLTGTAGDATKTAARSTAAKPAAKKAAVKPASGKTK